VLAQFKIGDWRAEFVRDIGYKVAFGLIKFLQTLVGAG
jgi:hypothetical protein